MDLLANSVGVSPLRLVRGRSGVDLYNFARQHKALRLSPAMPAAIADRLWSMEDIAALIDEAAPKPGRPATYKKREAAISN